MFTDMVIFVVGRRDLGFLYALIYLLHNQHIHLSQASNHTLSVPFSVSL